MTLPASLASRGLAVLVLALATSRSLVAQPLVAQPLARRAVERPSAPRRAVERPSAPRRAVELTFLKSTPGLREQLKTFIVRNWFAMDRVAKAQGLLSAFTIMDTGSDDGPWNVVVAVTYPNDKGYEGITEAFERIRRAHTTVRVEGKDLRDLGTIVDSKRLFEDP